MTNSDLGLKNCVCTFTWIMNTNKILGFNSQGFSRYGPPQKRKEKKEATPTFALSNRKHLLIGGLYSRRQYKVSVPSKKKRCPTAYKRS